MISSREHCRLCRALHNPFASGVLRPVDTPLFSTATFVILPALGPLVPGHALAVSRKHYDRLASMPTDTIVEYDTLVRSLRRLPNVSENLLEAEHGPTAECSAGGCVTHTHINLLPGCGDWSDLLESGLPTLKIMDDLTDLRDVKEPYILLRGNSGPAKLLMAAEAAPQEIRRALCRRLKIANWDWRTDARDELINKTIEFWNEALHG
jgi:hypothetical protein